jgi:hypothetical protein
MKNIKNIPCHFAPKDRQVSRERRNLAGVLF